MSNISLTTLGGVRENGKNMYIAEIDDSIFVLDAGLKYPENEQLGVDVVIPNRTIFLKIVIVSLGSSWTHGHADAIGALPYLLAEAKVPVFGSELTIELAKLFVKGNDTVKKFNDFHVIDEDTEIDFGGTVVSFFRTTHSIPESLGVVLRQLKVVSFIQVTSNLTRQLVNLMRQTSLVWQKSVVTEFWLFSVIQPMQTVMFKWLAKVKLGMKSPKPLRTGRDVLSLRQ